MRYTAFVKCPYSDWYSLAPLTFTLPVQCPETDAVDSSAIFANLYLMTQCPFQKPLHPLASEPQISRSTQPSILILFTPHSLSGSLCQRNLCLLGTRWRKPLDQFSSIKVLWEMVAICLCEVSFLGKPEFIWWIWLQPSIKRSKESKYLTLCESELG
jgi:hypothetical protein